MIVNNYIPMDNHLEQELDNVLNNFGFTKKKAVLRGVLFENKINNMAIIIDRSFRQGLNWQNRQV